jgi:anti-sigma B factor antagonist
MPARPVTLATYDRLGQTLVGTPTVSTLTGPDAGELAAELCEQIYAKGRTESGDEAAPAGVRHVVLDLQNVQYMDSMCVGVLVELLTTLKEAGGRIALVNASANVEYLFKLTRLDRVFPICRDVMKAIEAVERGSDRAE